MQIRYGYLNQARHSYFEHYLLLIAILKWFARLPATFWPWQEASTLGVLCHTGIRHCIVHTFYTLVEHHRIAPQDLVSKRQYNWNVEDALFVFCSSYMLARETCDG